MKTLCIAAVCLTGLFVTANANAQTPFSGLSDMVQMNLEFDARMAHVPEMVANQFLVDRWNYRVQNNDWGYIPGPVSPMDVSRTISDLNQTYMNNNEAWRQNSMRTDAAIDRWSTGFRGDWYYGDPNSGTTYTLPYTVDSYTKGPYGDIYEGYTPGGENFYPIENYGYGN